MYYPVTVLEIRDSFALSLAKSTLEDAGIGYAVRGDDPLSFERIPGTRGIGEIPLCNCTCWIMVAPEDESEARALLEPLANPEPLAEGSDVPS